MTIEDTHFRDRISGQNQSGLRDQNARLVLSYLRRFGDMPGAEIARRSGLSAQTVSTALSERLRLENCLKSISP